ncbi:MAG: nucleotidyltransferase family protein [Planctomycetes bacterium]|nr:nucleotidyltransferase family protein [Planctomycetota bacterium]
MSSTAYREYVMAVDRVEKRLRKVASALDEAGIKYAVIGGNAVAAWVARVDPSATRSTKDVDLLVEANDIDRITQVFEGINFTREEVMGLTLFIDPDEPSVRSAVHLIWANQPVRPDYKYPAPSVDDVQRDPQGFCVLDLPALVRMKLTSHRDIDRVHIRDLLSVGLIDQFTRESLPKELQDRLTSIEEAIED